MTFYTVQSSEVQNSALGEFGVDMQNLAFRIGGQENTESRDTRALF